MYVDPYPRRHRKLILFLRFSLWYWWQFAGSQCLYNRTWWGSTVRLPGQLQSDHQDPAWGIFGSNAAGISSHAAFPFTRWTLWLHTVLHFIRGHVLVCAHGCVSLHEIFLMQPAAADRALSSVTRNLHFFQCQSMSLSYQGILLFHSEKFFKGSLVIIWSVEQLQKYVLMEKRASN